MGRARASARRAILSHRRWLRWGAEVSETSEWTTNSPSRVKRCSEPSTLTIGVVERRGSSGSCSPRGGANIGGLHDDDGQSSRALTACYSMHYSDNDDTRESPISSPLGASPHRGGLGPRLLFVSAWRAMPFLLLRRRILLLGGVFLRSLLLLFSLDVDFSPCSDFPASDLSPFLSFLCLRLFFDLFSPASSADSSACP